MIQVPYDNIYEGLDVVYKGTFEVYAIGHPQLMIMLVSVLYDSLKNLF